MCAGWAFWGMSWPCNWAFQLRSCGHWSSFLVIAPVGGGIPLRCSIVGLKTLVGNASTQTQLFAPQAWQGGLVVIGTSWARFWPFATVPSCSCAVASLDFLFCKATRPKCRILWKPCMWRYVEQEAPDEHYYEKVSPVLNEPLYTRTVLPVPIKSGYSGVSASPCHVLHGGAGYSITCCFLSIPIYCLVRQIFPSLSYNNLKLFFY